MSKADRERTEIAKDLPDLKPGWSWALLSHLGELNRGKSKHRPRDDERLYGGAYPFIQTGDVRRANGGQIRSFSQTYSEFGLQQSRLWPAGTLCITIAANIAETGILEFDACFPDSVVGFTSSDSTLVRLVEYYMRTAKQKLARYAPATAQKNINLETLFGLPVPVPPSDEGARIVEALDSYLTRLDAAAEGLRRVEANLKRYRATVLKAAVEGRLVPTEAELAKREGRTYEPASVLLARILEERRRRWEAAELTKMKAKGESPKTDAWKSKYQAPSAPDTTTLPALPEGWCWASPGQLFQWSSGDFLPKGDMKEGDVPVYGGNGVNGRHSLSNIAIDVLVVGRVGAQCGNVHVARAPAWITDNAIFTKYVPTAANLAFWQLVLTCTNLNANAAGTGQPYVNQSHLNALCIPMPPAIEQERIANECARLMSTGNALSVEARNNMNHLTRLRQSILTWAFEGKLVDQDPNDQPASVLLDRIRAQREARAAAPKPEKAGRRMPARRRR